MKLQRSTCFIGGLTGAALLLAGCQNKAAAPVATASSPAVATVNGTVITREYFEDYVRAITQGKKPGDLTPEQRGQVLDDIVRHELVAQQAAKDGVESDPDTAFMLKATRNNVLWEATARRYLKDKPPSEQELKAEYDAGIARLPHQEYHARDILVPTAEAARKIVERLRKGEKFEALAKAESTDSARAHGGDLGWVSPQYIDPSMAEALGKLGPGEYTTSPVPTQGGWRLLQLVETRDLKLPPFDAEMHQRLTQMLQVRKFQGYTDELIRNAKIEKTLEAQKSATAPAAAPAAAAPASADAAASTSAAPTPEGSAARPASGSPGSAKK